MSTGSTYAPAPKALERSQNRELKELAENGFGCHHAGMLRTDRTLCEKLFRLGQMRVLCCTATLAWGVAQGPHGWRAGDASGPRLPWPVMAGSER